MDHTEQFHETKEEYLEATRRRMSSFPPSDGDESSIILERIHYLSTLEGDAQTPVSESCGPLKLLKKSLALPLTCGSGFGGSSGSGGRWKSAVDISCAPAPTAPAAAVAAAENLQTQQNTPPPSIVLDFLHRCHQITFRVTRNGQFGPFRKLAFLQTFYWAFLINFIWSR